MYGWMWLHECFERLSVAADMDRFSDGILAVRFHIAHARKSTTPLEMPCVSTYLLMKIVHCGLEKDAQCTCTFSDLTFLTLFLWSQQNEKKKIA